MLDAILLGPDASRHRLALLRHESKIASAGLRAIARKPLDLLTVVVALPVGLLVMRAWTSGQPQQLLALQAFAVGFLVAFYCAMGLLHRCNYHRTDGILAADAQRAAERLAFASPLFAATTATGFAYLVIVNAHRPGLWLAGTLLGAIAGLAWAHLSRVLRERRLVLLHWLRWRHLPGARSHTLLIAVGAAMGSACAILPLELKEVVIATAAISMIVSLVLVRVDAAETRYRTMVGHSSWAIVASHVSPLLAFLGPFAATLTLAPHWAPAAVVAVLGLAITAFVAIRVLAYQSFNRRIADWIVTVLVAASAMVGLALPPAAPVAMLFGIVWLARRAASQAWIIA